MTSLWILEFCASLLSEGPDASLLSPIRFNQMKDGMSTVLVPTTLFQRYEIVNLAVAEADAKMAEAENDVGFDDAMDVLEAEEAIIDLVGELIDAPQLEVRVRRQTLKFQGIDPIPKVAAKRGRASEKKDSGPAKRPPRIKQLPSGVVSRIGSIDPRTGIKYSREMYAPQMAGNSIRSAVDTAAAVSSAVALSEARHTLELLKAAHVSELRALQILLDVANDQLKDATMLKDKAVAAAKLKERSICAEKVKIATYDGMNAAVRLMNKKEVRSSSSGASGSCSVRKAPVSPLSPGYESE